VKLMSEITRILSAIERGDARAASELLPLHNDDLHWLAKQRMIREPNPAPAPDQCQRMPRVDAENARPVPGGHFFAAAAEALRRILVDSARQEITPSQEGETNTHARLTFSPAAQDIVILDEALTLLARKDPAAAQLIQLRYFAGLSLEQAADTLGITAQIAETTWRSARDWLLDRIQVHGGSRCRTG
jgi:RNA polymerase sigma factor (TIGR02999 family)